MADRYVIFLPGDKAHHHEFGVDYELMVNLKQYFIDKGIIVQDMLFSGGTTQEQIMKANNMLDNMESDEKVLKCLIYWMK